MLENKTNISRIFTRANAIAWTLIITYLAAAFYFLSDYFIPDVNIYMGLILAPYILIVKKGEYSIRYLLPLIIFLTLLFFIPVKTILFLVVLFGMLLSIESCIGKINSSFLFLLLLLSPIFKYFNSLIGFPIRLWLSEITGELLKPIEKNIEIVGNIIILNGTEFSVDAACAGLKMLTVSFIIAIFIVTFYQRKTRKTFSFFRVLVFLGSTFILNIISNLLRIITLVLFRIMPDMLFHDIIGIICLILYVIFPLFFISKLLFDSKPQNEALTIFQTAPPAFNLTLNSILVAILFIGASRINTFTTKAFSEKDYYIHGYQKEILTTGIMKFENDHSLVYIKPMNFYAPEHNPMICWTGSGYEFKQINKEIISGKEIYTGLIKKDKEMIYTAWWYDNGKHKTINQFDWRWKAAKGKDDYSLININAVSKERLIVETKKLLKITSYTKQLNHGITQ